MSEISPAPQQVAETSVQEAKPAAKPAVSEKNFQAPLKPGEDGLESARLAKEQSDKYLDAVTNATPLEKTPEGKVKNPADEMKQKQEEAAQAQQLQVQQLLTDLSQKPEGERNRIYDDWKKKNMPEEQIKQYKGFIEELAAQRSKIDSAKSEHVSHTEKSTDTSISSQASEGVPDTLEEEKAAEQDKIQKAVEPIKKLLDNPVVKVLTFPLKVIGRILGIPIRFVKWAAGWIRK